MSVCSFMSPFRTQEIHNGTPIVLVQKFPDMGDMQRFAVLTPQHGEDFQKALQMLNLAPVTISKLVIK